MVSRERVCVWNCIHHKLNYFGGKLYIRSLNNLEQPTSCYFSIVLKSKKVSLHQLNSKERYSMLCYLGNESVSCCLLLWRQGWIKTWKTRLTFSVLISSAENTQRSIMVGAPTMMKFVWGLLHIFFSSSHYRSILSIG